MIVTFNSTTYKDLLMETVPKVIETEAEYERILEIVEALTFEQNPTSEQTALHSLLVLLIETYEANHYPMGEPSPHEVLGHILEASGTEVADLIGLLGSEERVMAIVKGEVAMEQVEAKILGDRFKVSPGLFC
jgi:HTH-type transcriptional regulator/antitoxin HigA